MVAARPHVRSDVAERHRAHLEFVPSARSLGLDLELQRAVGGVVASAERKAMLQEDAHVPMGVSAVGIDPLQLAHALAHAAHGGDPHILVADEMFYANDDRRGGGDGRQRRRRSGAGSGGGGNPCVDREVKRCAGGEGKHARRLLLVRDRGGERRIAPEPRSRWVA